MAGKLPPFRLSFSKVKCKRCSWPLAHAYADGGDVRIEVKVSLMVISMEMWPEYIKCGRCGTLNTAEDMRKNSEDIRATTEAPTDQEARTD